MPMKPLSQAARQALARAYPEEAARKSHGIMRVEAKAEDTAELLIYGDIGACWWDDESVSALSVVEALQGLNVKTINVRISSDGGSVKDGFAIHNELRRQAANGVSVNTYVDSVAYSIASLIAAAGDTVTMYQNSLLMLHAPMVGLYFEGNAKQLKEVHDELSSWLTFYGKGMATSYARKTGKPASDFEEMWAQGTDFKYTADEAKAFGLCDVVVDFFDAAPDAELNQANASLMQHLVAHAPSELQDSIRAAFKPAAKTAAGKPDPQASARAPQAAPSAAKPHEDTPMPEAKKTADNLNPADNTHAVQAAAYTALRDRNTEIKALAEQHFGNAEVKAYYDDVIAAADIDITASDVGKKILAILAKDREPLNGGARATAGKDERDKARAAMGNAIEARAGMAKAEPGNPYTGFTLAEMARESLVRAGVDTRGMSRMDVVGLAFTHSTSDFPNLLGDSARKAVLKGYEEVATNLEAISRPVSVPDFNPRTLVGLGAFSDLDKVPENDEYKYGTFSDLSSRIQLVTYGKLFSISRQAIINDDLSVFSDVPRKMGQAARRTIAKALFNLVTSNPVLGDGFALFSTQHNNLAATGTVISTANVDAMRVAMALQKDSDGNAIAMPLKTLLTPIALGGLARTVRESQYSVDASAKNSTQPNIVRGTFEVVDDPQLDANSATAWYGLADPAIVDALVIAYLDGKQEPYMEQKEGFTVDGVAWKVRIDAAPAIGDYRGIYKNPGA